MPPIYRTRGQVNPYGNLSDVRPDPRAMARSFMPTPSAVGYSPQNRMGMAQTAMQNYGKQPTLAGEGVSSPTFSRNSFHNPLTNQMTQGTPGQAMMSAGTQLNPGPKYNAQGQLASDAGVNYWEQRNRAPADRSLRGMSSPASMVAQSYGGAATTQPSLNPGVSGQPRIGQPNALMAPNSNWQNPAKLERDAQLQAARGASMLTPPAGGIGVPPRPSGPDPRTMGGAGLPNQQQVPGGQVLPSSNSGTAQRDTPVGGGQQFDNDYDPVTGAHQGLKPVGGELPNQQYNEQTKSGFMYNPATGKNENYHYDAQGNFQWGGNGPGFTAVMHTLPDDPSIDQGEFAEGENAGDPNDPFAPRPPNGGPFMPQQPQVPGTTGQPNPDTPWHTTQPNLPQPSQGGNPLIDPSTGRPYVPNEQVAGGQIPSGGQGGVPNNPYGGGQGPNTQPQQPNQGQGMPTIPPQGGTQSNPTIDPTIAQQLLNKWQTDYDTAKQNNANRANELRDHYNARYARGLANLQGVGDQASADINAGAERLAADADQDLISRGFRNSTVRQNVQRGVEDDRVANQNRLSAMIADKRTNTDANLSGDTLEFLERIQEDYPSSAALMDLQLRLAQSGYGGNSPAQGGGASGGGVNTSSPWIPLPGGGLVRNPNYNPNAAGGGGQQPPWMYSVTTNPTTSNPGDSSNLFPQGTNLGVSVGNLPWYMRPSGSVYFGY